MSLLLYALALASQASATQGRDWGKSLRLDATALHDQIAANHPGPVNPSDPGFATRNDEQLTRALNRATTAKRFADYFYALQEYAASFDDGHLAYGVFGATPDEVRAWPGFLTRYDGNGRQIVYASEPWSAVPLGARLVSCDGLTADDVAQKRIGTRVGRWNLEAQRATFGAMTFLDTGNPYVGTVHQCWFDDTGRPLKVALKWRQPQENLYQRYEVFPSRGKSVSKSRRLQDGTRWFAIPSFNGDPDSDAGKSLRGLLANLDSNAAEIRSAPAIVLDLRGNGGGSSDWSYQIATRLWGKGAIEAHPEPPMTVSWRASPGNLDSIRNSYAERSKGGHMSAEMASWYADTIAGLQKAIAERKPLWVIKPETTIESGSPNDPVYSIAGPVYVLTDSACMSACLDAVDLWTRLGAIPVGRETDADTLYMEVRSIPLPSGVGAISVPMKVYSGRVRGSNEPVVPRHRFNGDITDTAALERWIATLPERRNGSDFQ